MEWYNTLCPHARVDKATMRLSLVDLVQAAVECDARQACKTIKRFMAAQPDTASKIVYTRICGKGQRTPTVAAEESRRIIASIPAGARVSTAQKHKVLQVVDMEAQMRQYIEPDIMEGVTRAFAHLRPSKQFPIGSYRIDLYFPEQKLAVECDEYGHNQYNDIKEAVRQQFIQEQLQCRFHRFNPHSIGFCLHSLICQLMQLLTVPKRG